jgi:hypothetical protein
MEDKRILEEINRSKQLINFSEIKEKTEIQEEIEDKQDDEIVSLREFVNRPTK